MACLEGGASHVDISGEPIVSYWCQAVKFFSFFTTTHLLYACGKIVFFYYVVLKKSKKGWSKWTY